MNSLLRLFPVAIIHSNKNGSRRKAFIISQTQEKLIQLCTNANAHGDKDRLRKISAVKWRWNIAKMKNLMYWKGFVHPSTKFPNGVTSTLLHVRIVNAQGQSRCRWNLWIYLHKTNMNLHFPLQRFWALANKRLS